jgi:hypothetical protein
MIGKDAIPSSDDHVAVRHRIKEHRAQAAVHDLHGLEAVERDPKAGVGSAAEAGPAIPDALGFLSRRGQDRDFAS